MVPSTSGKANAAKNGRVFASGVAPQSYFHLGSKGQMPRSTEMVKYRATNKPIFVQSALEHLAALQPKETPTATMTVAMTMLWRE